MPCCTLLREVHVHTSVSARRVLRDPPQSALRSIFEYSRFHTIAPSVATSHPEEREAPPARHTPSGLCMPMVNVAAPKRLMLDSVRDDIGLGCTLLRLLMSSLPVFVHDHLPTSGIKHPLSVHCGWLNLQHPDSRKNVPPLHRNFQPSNAEALEPLRPSPPQHQRPHTQLRRFTDVPPSA